jgi:hypothetical protein
VPGGGVEPPRPEGRRILSPLRLPVPPSRHFVEVLDFTAYFTFSVFFIPDNDCETVQVNVKVFMDFHRFLSRAHGVLCGSPRVTMSPWLSNNEDIRTRFYHSTHSHPQHRGPFLAKCARNGAPRVIVGARKSEVGDPPEFPCRTHFLRQLRTRVAEIPAKQARLLSCRNGRAHPRNAERPYRIPSS